MCLYHPWSTHSVSIQAKCSESPIPHGYNLNYHHHYIPFRITNAEGKKSPAKYVQVFMTSNPYALSKLTSDDKVYKAEIHTAPHYNYPLCKNYSDNDLHKLLSSWFEAQEVNNTLIRLKDCSLQAEVHCYHCQRVHLGQLDAQIKAIKEEMYTIFPLKHECVQHLSHVQALQRIWKMIGQRIHKVGPEPKLP